MSFADFPGIPVVERDHFLKTHFLRCSEFPGRETRPTFSQKITLGHPRTAGQILLLLSFSKRGTRTRGVGAPRRGGPPPPVINIYAVVSNRLDPPGVRLTDPYRASPPPQLRPSAPGRRLGSANAPHSAHQHRLRMP